MTVGRSTVAAAGAAAGALVAVPVGGVLFEFLFERVGKRLIDDMFSDAARNASGAEAILGGIFLPIAAVLVAILVVVALVAPVFVVLPMAGIAVALRSVRAGLILRSVGSTFVAALVLFGGVLLLASVVEVNVGGWAGLLMAAIAGCLGRLFVELRWPVRAGVPDRTVVGPRWRRFAVAWLVIVVVAVVAVIALVLGGAQSTVR